jgi:hypothetical protein
MDDHLTGAREAMMNKPEEGEARGTEQDRESGAPGGGQGRRDEVGGSGVYPASAGEAPADAVIRTPAAWGQGVRGAEGYEDSGSSELFFTEAELEAARQAEAAEKAAADERPDEAESEPEP